jgi:hypothetical protein
MPIWLAEIWLKSWTHVDACALVAILLSVARVPRRVIARAPVFLSRPAGVHRSFRLERECRGYGIEVDPAYCGCRNPSNARRMRLGGYRSAVQRDRVRDRIDPDRHCAGRTLASDLKRILHNETRFIGSAFCFSSARTKLPVHGGQLEFRYPLLVLTCATLARLVRSTTEGPINDRQRAYG